MDSYGRLTFAFSRPVVFPKAILKEFDSDYREEVPVLMPSEEDL